MHRIDAIVLSAGKASRFGVPKFALPAGPGEVLLTRALAQALWVVDGRVVVVVGHEAGLAQLAVERWLDRNPGVRDRVRLCENPHYAKGQSTSLQAGLRALEGSAGALVFLADMPGLDQERLMQLREAIRTKRPSSLAVAPAELGQPRPPVYLAAGLFAQIEQLAGDQGARALLQAQSSQVELLEWGTGPWFADVDTWSAYRTLARAKGWDREPFRPIPKHRPPLDEVVREIDPLLASERVPWLAPGVLLSGAGGASRWLELARPYRGVVAVVRGPGRTPAQYLRLLRRAVLMALTTNS
ncbi:nucleotidyltransferase family protein [Meiothermus rufus]|uniref:nucleotidyltransferase family protein n=1 Tax=Meiothermus rufus TaxID=604332 RepID=UPI0003FFB5E3|nr:nucleotidyltransferase family protein [Meiothermus rufus]